ncbi:MAG: GNAT family N-acetyltransferase [Bacteroidetes bacterium GWA2_31_9b]|nr:MAG: GNAT family N-acetyltransferase [Bacteroidetes bacterium GWA2_31_9b]
MQITESLNSAHNRKKFCCGKPMLDNYLHRQASQDVKRKLSVCFVFLDKSDSLIKGYYTLSNNSIPLEFVPDSFIKKLPKSYTSIPTILLGRLAIDINYQGQGIGKLLLIDALKRCYLLSKSIGSFAVIVDPLDTEAETFYSKYGFIKLPDSGKMFLPMKTISLLFKE